MALPKERSYIKKMLRKKLAEQEAAFGIKHCSDTDEQLLEYLRRCAAELGGTVYNGGSVYNYDIVGTKLLKERFGDNWDKILSLAGLPKIAPPERSVRGCLYCREIRRLEWCVDKTREALAKQEQEFEAQYNEAANEELLGYIKGAADRLGYTPASADIVGKNYISKRFGSWGEAIRRAGLPKPTHKYEKPEDGRLFMEEFRRQEAVYAENVRQLVEGNADNILVLATDKVAKKIKRDAALEEKAHTLAKRMLQFKEKLFAAEYAKASDNLLLHYLAECSQELGRLPCKCEVIGGEYLEQRFGGWERALEKANCQGEPDTAPKQPLIYIREVRIQKYLLEGREYAVRMLYKSPLIGKMQAGNVFHILRWNPAAINSAESQCYNFARERLERQNLGRPINQNELEAEAVKVKTIYNKTLGALDLQRRQFEAKYKKADKKELWEYVQQRVQELHTTPEMLDVLGAEFILRNLNYTWGMVLRKLRLKKSGRVHKIYQSKLFLDEFARQERLYEASAAESEAVM